MIIRLTGQIIIQSFKISGDFQIAFDFENPCCALEYGTFKYLSVNSPNTYGDFGCSIDFSKIKKVYIRRTPRSLTNQILIYDKSFLMGNKKLLRLDAGNISVTLPIQSVVGSIQMSAYCSILMYDNGGNVINNSVSAKDPISLYQMPALKNFGFIGRVERFDVRIETPAPAPASVPAKPPVRIFQ